MDGKHDVSGSIMVISENSIDGLCPMAFGVSCAFFALGLLPEPEICDKKWSEIRTRMLKGSAHLLGLLVWRVQRGVFISERFDLLKNLESAQNQVLELKKRRSEEAKANEKVVSIFAAREQSWFDERRQLRQQIDALMNDLRMIQEKNKKSLAEMSGKLEETQVILQLKDKMMEEVEQRKREAEEKLKKAESLAEELRECVRIEMKRRSCEVSELVELVSNHCQLEVELGRAHRQVEAAKQKLDSVKEQKEQLRLANKMLSLDLVKIRKDLEHKDRILSAVLRKAKEKQMFLQEVKSSPVSVSEHEGHSFKNPLPKLVQESIDELSVSKALSAKDMRELGRFNYLKTEHLQHGLNIDGIVEQLRLKDEKLESFRWRLMRMELESKRFQAHIEGLHRDIAQLSRDNGKLEGLLFEREAKLHPLKVRDAVRSKGKVFRRKSGHKKQEMEAAQDIIFTLESPTKEIKEMKANAVTTTSLGIGLDLSKPSNSTWKMDIHSLGVTYKIKRLKQQLIILESSENNNNNNNNGHAGGKGLCALLSSLNKQADRYESLQRKIDDLCKRMHGDDTKRLEQFLEETFQLQRYIVATGQKLMEVQAKIASGFDGVVSLDMKQFGDSISCLVREVQRGLELQVSRIIGDLEGTLTSHI